MVFYVAWVDKKLAAWCKYFCYYAVAMPISMDIVFGLTGVSIALGLGWPWRWACKCISIKFPFLYLPMVPSHKWLTLLAKSHNQRGDFSLQDQLG